LRVWKRADEDRVLRAPSAPVPAGPGGLSRVLVPTVVSGLSDYGRLRLRQWSRAVRPLLPPVAGGLVSRMGRARRGRGAGPLWGRASCRERVLRAASSRANTHK